jgi:hypothetical protein
MTDTAISPLRRRMIEDMTIRQLKPTTQHNYIRQGVLDLLRPVPRQGGVRGCQALPDAVMGPPAEREAKAAVSR